MVNTTDEIKESKETDFVDETEETSEISEASETSGEPVRTTEIQQETKESKKPEKSQKKSKYAGYNYSFDFSNIRKGDIPDFLKGKVKEVYCKAYIIEKMSITDNTLLFVPDGNFESDTNRTIEYSGTTYYRTGFSFESFENFLPTIFTSAKVNEIFSRGNLIDVDGEVCVILGEGASEVMYKEVDFKILSKLEDRVKFKYSAHYAYDYMTEEEFEERFEGTDVQYKYDEEGIIEILKTEKGWHVGALDMWK